MRESPPSRLNSSSLRKPSGFKRLLIGAGTALGLNGCFDFNSLSTRHGKEMGEVDGDGGTTENTDAQGATDLQPVVDGNVINISEDLGRQLDAAMAAPDLSRLPDMSTPTSDDLLGCNPVPEVSDNFKDEDCDGWVDNNDKFNDPNKERGSAQCQKGYIVRVPGLGNYSCVNTELRPLPGGDTSRVIVPGNGGKASVTVLRWLTRPPLTVTSSDGGNPSKFPTSMPCPNQPLPPAGQGCEKYTHPDNANSDTTFVITANL